MTSSSEGAGDQAKTISELRESIREHCAQPADTDLAAISKAGLLAYFNKHYPEYRIDPSPNAG